MQLRDVLYRSLKKQYLCKCFNNEELTFNLVCDREIYSKTFKCVSITVCRNSLHYDDESCNNSKRTRSRLYYHNFKGKFGELIRIVEFNYQNIRF